MSDNITQEVRFAVVMYGGVSLAIYINGAAQEMLSMVRATSLPLSELSPTEKVYRKLGQILYHGRKPGEAFRPDNPVRTRILVDILSGTSAGGINAVFLAKAMAQGETSLKSLRDLWLEKADMEKLLNDDDAKSRNYPPSTNKTSLLNNNYMYGSLLDAFRGMNSGRAPLVDPIDLFTTTTDLAGIDVPIQLTGARVIERVHKTVFHFELDGEKANDFTSSHDPMLAFASRCTSSFPVAFEPMRVRNIENCGVNLSANEQTFKPFFGKYATVPGDWTKRLFADGGYLDNKPFSYAIQAIPHRDSDYPYLRKLIFIDPFPELENNSSGTTDIDFVTNAKLAATDLPTYETIRGDIESVNERNLVQGRAKNLRRRVELTRGIPTVKTVRPYPEADLPEMVDLHGPAYALYHHIRVFRLTDWLADIGTRLGGLVEGSDQQLGLRYLLRVWRDSKFFSHRGTCNVSSKTECDTENRYLHRFDIDFRIRRAHYMRKRIDEVTATLNDEKLHWKIRQDRVGPLPPERRGPLDMKLVRQELATRRAQLRLALRELRDLRRSVGKSGDDTLGNVLKSGEAASLADDLASIVSTLNDGARYRAANALLKKHGPLLDRFAEALGGALANVATLSDRVRGTFMGAATSKEAFAVNGWLHYQYRDFMEYDMVTLPVLEGTEVSDFTEVEIFRISPVDSTLKPDPNKLAGLSLGHFGAFLSEEWRSNDMAWGRLDAAERIVFACLPDEADKPLRDRLIHEVQELILEEEFSPARTNRIAKWVGQQLQGPVSEQKVPAGLVQQLQAVLPVPGTSLRAFVEHHYTVPSGPGAKQSMSWAGRATRILGKMFEDIEVEAGSRLKWIGGLAVNVVRVSVPGIPATIFDWGLRLFLAASLLLIVSESVVKQEGLRKLGYISLACTLGVMVVRTVLSLWFAERKSVLRTIKRAATVVAIGVFGVGVVTSWNWLAAHWPF